MTKKLLMSFVFLLCFIFRVSAQDRTISGKVTSSEDGTALPGVSVGVKGSTKGTVTNADGTYKIGIPANAVINFSFVGFKKESVSVGVKNTVDVVLKSDASEIDEVVVVGYGSVDKKSYTGTQTKVEASNIEGRPFSSAVGALQGQVAGLQTTATTGQPGAFQAVRIRGIGSINAGADPLYVIDGIPVNNGDFSNRTTSSSTLAGLNPNDIEEMVVLKDAASTSIYGSRGANGVILITTRKGKSGKTVIRGDVEFGKNTTSISNLAKPMNRQEYFDITREGLVNSGATQTTIDNTLNSLGFTNTDDVDWLSAVLRDGVTRNYNISAQGGDNKTRFYISGGYYKEEAIVIASEFSRISGNAKIDHNASEKLSIGLNVNVSGSDQLTPTNGGTFASPILSAYFLRPSQRLRNPDGTYDVSVATFPGVYNPVALAEVNKNSFFNLKGLAGVSVDYRPIKNLTLRSKFGIDFNAFEENQFRNGVFGDGRNTAGQSSADYTRIFNWNWVNQADYRAYFTADKGVFADVKVGYEAQLSKIFFSRVTSNGLPPTNDLIYPVVAATPVTASASGSDYSFGAVFSNLVFNYNNRYSVSGSFRQDKSSRFGINNRSGNFWSTGAAWNVDQETFMKDVSAISSLKLRGSYGVNGNAAIDNYLWRATYGYGFNYNQTPGSAPNNIGNADLSWELSKQLNVGTDISLLKNRLNLVVDYYVRKTEDLLLDAPLSRTSGFATQTANIGSMENSGWEFTISGTPVKTKGFSWDVNFNIALNTNKITGLVNGADIITGSFIRREGLDFQTFYAREWAGVNPENGAPQWYLNTTAADGTINRTITNNYNAAQRVTTLGSATPKGFGGLTNTFSYKGFSVEAQLYFSYGNMVQDTWAGFTQGDGANATFNKIKLQLDRWQKPGDVALAPKYVYNNPTLSNSFSSRYLYDGSYIRLRNLVVRYALPESILKTLKLSQMSVFVRGTNLLTILKDKNIYFDPEVGVAGQANNNIFIAKNFALGANISF
jgi:TonB-dependent starch-binding outer membrane protein SusC